MDLSRQFGLVLWLVFVLVLISDFQSINTTSFLLSYIIIGPDTIFSVFFVASFWSFCFLHFFATPLIGPICQYAAYQELSNLAAYRFPSVAEEWCKHLILAASSSSKKILLVIYWPIVDKLHLIIILGEPFFGRAFRISSHLAYTYTCLPLVLWFDWHSGFCVDAILILCLELIRQSEGSSSSHIQSNKVWRLILFPLTLWAAQE